MPPKIQRGKKIKTFADMEHHKLRYITQMLGEMRKMAEELDQQTLNYLIEMAQLEAHHKLEQSGSRKSGEPA